MARREGVNLILEGQVDQGLAKLEQAVKQDPKNVQLRQEYLRQRDQVIARLIAQGNSARAQGDFAAATEHFRHVLRLDGNNVMATNGLRDIDADRRHAAWLNEAQQRFSRGELESAKDILRMILIESPNDPQANLLRQKIEEKGLPEKVNGPQLNIQGRRPVTLQFRDANLKMVLDAISKATGVNVLLDKDVKNDIKITIFVKDSPIEETLDLILLQSQLEKRILGPNSILIYAATQAKQKEYQELKVRRFVLTNADPKQVQSMLKTILRVKDLYIDEKTNTVILRDTDHVIRLAEKLIASIDLPEPEVMLEVQLLDLDRKKTLQLGIDWPSAVSWVYPVAAGGATISELRALGRGAAKLTFTPNLGATLKALETDGDTRVLATPRIRTRSKEKARVMIGNRTPIISSAAAPSTAVGATPVYNTNIQYLDTGIKLEVEPTVYIDGEVSIKVALEVSDLGTKYENATTGTLAYATTTNNATTVLRLKDGETQVLAGLIRSQTGNSGNQKVPGLGDAPLIGRLFGVQSDTWENRELVLAITPRIVRNIPAGDAEVVEMWSGTESAVRFETFHKGPKALPAAPAARSEMPAESSTPVNAAPAPAPAAVEEAPIELTPAGVLMPKLTAPAEAKVGDVINVAVDLPAGGGINAMSFAIKYDKDKLELLQVTEGTLSTGGGMKSSFIPRIDPNGATAAGILQMDGGTTTSGKGALAVAQFRVIGSGKAVINPLVFTAMGPDKRALQVAKPWPLELMLGK